MRAVILSLAVVLVACGGDTEGGNVSEAGRLVVEKSLAAGPVFTEGSMTHVRIVRDDGATIVDGVKRAESLSTPLYFDTLRPGGYVIETVERPCSATCDALDGPVESTRCRRAVEVPAGGTTTVSLVLGMDGRKAVVTCA